MPNLFSGINIALRALLTHQQVIQVIEHNVANANTPGYHRQEAVLAASMPYDRPGLRSSGLRGQMGTGVQVERIRRFNLDFFNSQLRSELAEAKRWEMKGEVLRQVEISLAETSSDGLIQKLDAFWSGWQALSSDPTNLVLRNDLKERAAALAGAFNQRTLALTTLRKDQDLAIRQRIEETNELAAQVSRLNVEIANVKASGGEPNDHLDERDRLLERLAELAGATASVQADDTAMVSIGGHVLVVGAKAFQLAAQADGENDNLVKISWVEDGQAFKASCGELAGLLEARDGSIAGQIHGLNRLAFELATRVNGIHQAGYGLNGSTGQNFFAATQPLIFAPNASFAATINYALEIRLDAAILNDTANIAAASAGNVPGDGSQAIEIAGLKFKTILNGGTTTLNGYYTRQIGDLGLELKGAIAKARDRKLVADSLAMMAESVAGVSLDEEAANLVKAQRSFQAAARLMTAMDDMLDRIINGMGVVGR